MRGLITSSLLVLLPLITACATGDSGLGGLGGQLGAATGTAGSGSVTVAGTGASGSGGGPATTSGGGAGQGGGSATTGTTSGSTTAATTSSGSGGVPSTCAQANDAVGCCSGSGEVSYCKSGMTTVTHTTCPSGETCGWKAASKYYTCVSGQGTADPSGVNPMECP